MSRKSSGKKAKRRGIYERHNGLCYFCGQTLHGGSWQVHHRLSKKDGGTDARDNLVPVHSVCHKLDHGMLKLS